MNANDLTSISKESLPSILREIAEVTDVESAMKIVEKYGGQRRYFPFEPKSDHWLSTVVGHDKAIVICQAITPSIGMVLLMPLGPMDLKSIQKRQIRKLILAGYSNPAVASQVGVHSRTIQNHRKRMRKAGIKLPAKIIKRNS